MPIRGYSAGMSIRLSFAMATTMNPDILLMDEWFSAGDADFMRKAEERLAALVDKAEIMVIATHEMSFARQVADSVCFLADGGVLESGPPEQVFGSPRAPRLRNFLAAMSLQAPLEPGEPGGQDPAGR